MKEIEYKVIEKEKERREVEERLKEMTLKEK